MRLAFGELYGKSMSGDLTGLRIHQQRDRDMGDEEGQIEAVEERVHSRDCLVIDLSSLTTVGLSSGLELEVFLLRVLSLQHAALFCLLQRMQHIDLTISLFTMICSCLLTAPVARPTALAPSAALAAHNAAARPLERKVQRFAAVAVAATVAAAAAAPAHLPQADSALDDKLSSRPLELDAAGYFIIKVLIAAIVPPPAGQETCWPDRTCAPLLAFVQHASQGPYTCIFCPTSPSAACPQVDREAGELVADFYTNIINDQGGFGRPQQPLLARACALLACAASCDAPMMLLPLARRPRLRPGHGRGHLLQAWGGAPARTHLAGAHRQGALDRGA